MPNAPRRSPHLGRSQTWPIPRQGRSPHLGRVALAAGVLCALSHPALASASPNDDSQISYVGLDLSTLRSRPGGILIDPAFVLGFANPYFDVSLAFGGSSTNLLGGSRRAFNTIPGFGYHVGWRSSSGRRTFQLFVHARLPIQRRWGANLENKPGVAVSEEAGARLWRCGTDLFPHLCMGISVSARYQQNLTDYQYGSAILPRGSSVFSVPVTFTIGINPHAH